MRNLRILLLTTLLALSFALAVPASADCPPGDPDCPLTPPQSVEVNPNPLSADGSPAALDGEPATLSPLEVSVPMPSPPHVEPVLPASGDAFQTLELPLRYQQPGDVSCGVQALGMALEAFEAPAPASSALLEFLGENGMLYDFGTGVEELALAAQHFGYEGAYAFHGWDLERIFTELSEGRPVVVPLGVNGEAQAGHFVTLTGVSPDGEWVAFNDPALGEGRMPRAEFARLWALQGNSGVIVGQAAPGEAGASNLTPRGGFRRRVDGAGEHHPPGLEAHRHRWAGRERVRRDQERKRSPASRLQVGAV